MSTRLVSPWKRSNSSFYWFRMVVPTRYRRVVGKGEIKQSLNTADLGEARRLCAIRQGEWLERFDAIEAELQAQAKRAGVEVIDRHFEAESGRYGGLDRVIAYELECAAEAEQASIPVFAAEDFGLAPEADHPLLTASYPGYTDKAQRQAISLRRSMLRDRAAILSGAEAVHRIHSIRAWGVAIDFLKEAFEAAGVELDMDERMFAVAAEHYLRRLSHYPLPALGPLKAAFPLPPEIAAATTEHSHGSKPAPAVANAPAVDAASTSPLRERILGQPGRARTISQVFEAWAGGQPLESKKLCDEWRVAVRRFVELFGDQHVTAITSDMVLDFREAMRRLPSRPKRTVAALPLLEQIEVARSNGLRCLSGPTVGKLVSGIRVTLGYACDPLRLIKTNPAAAVSVADATSEPDARLAFEPHELAKIFGSDLMTDPDSKLTLTEFWLLFMAPLTGFRIEEMAKFRPQNIKRERGIWYIRVERDSRRKRREQAEAGQMSKRSKTRAAYRDVPLHWILIEAGFLEFVEHQRARGCDWLFDELEADRYGNRSKAVSRRLIRRIRKLGVDDEEKVFHSFRHAMKRACRQTLMKEEIADLLAGHAPASVGRKYGAGAALDVLQEAVNMVEYETIAWDPVISAAKRRLELGCDSVAYWAVCRMAGSD